MKLQNFHAFIWLFTLHLNQCSKYGLKTSFNIL